MDLENLLKRLSKSEKSELVKLLSVEEMDEHSRYKNGVVCPCCGNTHCNYHSGFKRWLGMFNGISTKYLNRYLAWFKFIKQKNDVGFLFNELILSV